jgi:DNA (cytosine-5)-methyltransferase 1
VLEDDLVRAAGLFSGIGGFELGLQRAGIETELLCEFWAPATSTLQRHFDVPIAGDIRELRSLPIVDVVTAGFPCTDLSSAGRTVGIEGHESGLVREVFRLTQKARPTWLVLENVPNMLSLHGGAPIRYITKWLDDNGWHWAYRTVDSQHFGVRQRRRRVFLVASRTEDPRTVLFADEAPSSRSVGNHSAYGFYWTEGTRGLGWGEGVTPTLKGGSAVGISSPPAVWRIGVIDGQAITSPSVEAGERLQGFRSGWTSHVAREGVRWKLVGNAVSVPVATWIGSRLVSPGRPVNVERRPCLERAKWARAASCVNGIRETWDLSERPILTSQRMTLDRVLDRYGSRPLSLGATRGFADRIKASRLARPPGFIAALDAHLHFMS